MLAARPTVRRTSRRAVAALEFAIVVVALTPLLLGLWEIGRAIQVQQIVAEAARQGARLAAQGSTVNQSGSPTQIKITVAPASNSTRQPNVKAAVMQTLYGYGLRNLAWGNDPSQTTDDVQVYFQFTDAGPSGTGPTGVQDPYLGVKGQTFTVNVIVKFSKVRWINLGIVNPSEISYTVTWQMLVDDPFNVNPSMPNM